MMVKINELTVCVLHLSKMMLVKKARFRMTHQIRQGSKCKTVPYSVYDNGYVGNIERILIRMKLLVVQFLKRKGRE